MARILTFLLFAACMTGDISCSVFAANLNYQTPANHKTECMGRHQIDLPGQIEWAMTDSETPFYAGAGFTKGVRATHDRWRYGKVRVAATYATTLEGYEERILKDRPEEHFLNVRYEEIGLGIPDARAFIFGDDIIAYLWRGKRVWRFALEKANDETFESTLIKLQEILGRFRVRGLYGVPTESGVCIPYGFFADNGDVSYQIRNSLRFQDAPNVIYSLGVGKNDEQYKKMAMYGWLTTLLDAGAIEKLTRNQRWVWRLMPTSVNIGGLQGRQAGFAIKVGSEKTEDQETTYLMQVGHDGKSDSDLFPFVAFQMRGFAKGEDPNLTKAAPPLKVSKARLMALMESVRLVKQEP